MKFMIGNNKDTFLVDTNILIYAYEMQDSMRKIKSQELMEKCWQNKIELAVSNQNLSEFFSVAVRKRKMNLEQAKTNVEDIINFNGFKKIDYTHKTILLAIDIVNGFQMPFWDSLLAATMKENNILNIYTENTRDFKMHWIKSVNPFALKKF